MRRFFLGGCVFAGVLARAHVAIACGGCFHEAPPPMLQQTLTVVTDHRMAFAVSPSATTLYDQIRYQGDPSAFAWVLPIAGTVEVGLSADVLFGTLDALTQTTLAAPLLPPCPPPPVCDFGSTGSRGGGGGCTGSKHAVFFGGDDGGAFDDDGAFSGPNLDPVEVTKHEVVGPYDTVQLKATDPMAIETWLTTNGFAVPGDVKPIIGAYQKEGFGFLALKLLPGKGVSAMRPVRVTSMGAGLGLPLRMVSAGTGANVGITLWIVAEGRYEPSNFATFRIRDDDLVWDWTTQSSNYARLRADMTAANNGAAWELESSLDIAKSAIERYILSGGQGFGTAPAAGDYLPIADPMNPKVVLKTADQARQDDLDALLAGMRQSGRVTRFRADLARTALLKDLQLTASADQAPISNNRVVKNDVNRPVCPTYPPCPTVVPNESARGGSACSTAAPVDSLSSAGIFIATGFLTASIVRRRRRRDR